jgi:signal transduction histidine kinase
MFINYRRPHSFSDEEKRIIDTIAVSAALAIRNRRLLETFSAVDRGIITTLEMEKVLNLIVERAVRITRADMGTLRLLEPISQELVVKARYPSDVSFDPSLEHLKIDEGVSGWVAHHGVSALVNDVKGDRRYKPYFSNARSELCVPLIIGEHHIMGVLNVEHYRPAAFNSRHQGILEALANQAIIAIQNATSQKRLVAAETMVALGDLASALVHRINNDLGAIRIRAQDIREADGIDEDIRSWAGFILSTVQRVLQDAQRLNRWMPDDSQQPIDLSQAVHDALARVDIPNTVTQRVNIPNSLPKVMGGARQLTEVFINVIQNARDAMPTGGTLSIHGEERDGGRWVVVQVCDTGKGIAKENIDKIFQRGFSTKDDRGLGYGLWWTQTCVERLGGFLTVRSQSGEGTEFTMMLACEPRE